MTQPTEHGRNEAGPTLPISKYIHETKYRAHGETYSEAMCRIASALKDDDEHYFAFKEILDDMRFSPAGRVQSAVGSPREVTPYNCFVADSIPDSMEGILRVLGEATETMRQGGGIGYDFSTLRPAGDHIISLDSQASGPVSFMAPFDAMCGTIASAGHRRGAQMGVLRVDHPDIEEFVHAKQNSSRLTNFNISIGVTDVFMDALRSDTDFNLTFEGRVYKTIKAKYLWEQIMRSTWDWAEPGVLFIDTINKMNNLWYCESIAATNPCGEQPLPPHGACLLGSFNLTRYIKKDLAGRYFDMEQFRLDIPTVVRAMDNVVDVAKYPLRVQETEAKNKRRMGLGYMGLANALEALGLPYGSQDFLRMQALISETLLHEAYKASIQLAKEKGPFRLYDAGPYLAGKFIQQLPQFIRDGIAEHGIRNSHLTSIAPTGTISLAADNISSGLEPVFAYEVERTINTMAGIRQEKIQDYGYRVFGVKGKRTEECTADDHLNVLLTASKYVDSAVSKTCNVNKDMPWEEFKNIYIRAYNNGAKGCTTFNPGGKRFGILNSVDTEGEACYIDEYGNKTCE